MCEHFFILLCHLTTFSSIATGTLNNQGKEFIFSFTEAIDQNNDMKIIVTTSKTTDVEVSVTSPNWFEPYINETFTISSGKGKFINISAKLCAIGTELSTKGILVNASHDVFVYGLQLQRYSADGFLALPTVVLGTEYYTACYYPPEKKTEFLIAGIQDSTLVNILISKNANSENVRYNGKSYKPGESITLTMNRYDTFQAQSNGDLTGSYVTSDKPISVLSGNIEAEIKPGYTADHLIEQLPPVSAWGTRFAVIPTPERNQGDYIKIVASVSDTVINHTCGKDGVTSGNATVLQKPGHFSHILLEPDSYCYVESNEAVLVVKFITSFVYGEEGGTDTSMFVIPPIERCYASQYTFATPKTSQKKNFENYVLFVASSSEIPRLTLDGEAITDLTFRGIPKIGLSAGYFNVTHGEHTVRRSSSTSVFCGLLYGRAKFESYGFPLGFCLANPSKECLGPRPREACVNNSISEAGMWKGSLQNVNIKSGTIWIEMGTESLISCALVCLRDCRCLSYTYHSGDRTCRGHSHTHTSLGNTDYTAQQGYVYWVLEI